MSPHDTRRTACKRWQREATARRVRCTPTGRFYRVCAATGDIERLTRCPYCLKFFIDAMGYLTEAARAHRTWVRFAEHSAEVREDDGGGPVFRAF